MRNLVFWLLAAAAASAQPPRDWALVNFADRLEVEVANPSDHPVSTLAVIPVAAARQVALRFPGSLAIAVSGAGILPSQADDLDGDGNPDEFVFPVALAAGEKRAVRIYYSATLTDWIPWPKRVHASHAFGYNRATVALESELIGYRTYGGFFLDIQARGPGRPGLYNSLVGYFAATNPAAIGRDVIHLGDTLGLGGLFLRSGQRLFRPPLNMPDYAHKPAPPQSPDYRVLADGPVRAVVEARMDRWKIGEEEVAIRARYSIAAGATVLECRFHISPLRLTGSYEVGAGVRHLPSLQTDPAPGRILLSGTQTPQIGPLAMALFYDPAAADPAPPVQTREDRNECVVFRRKLAPGRAAGGVYWLAAAWSGSGIPDLMTHLKGVEPEARARVTVSGFQHARTPLPQRVEGEAY